ncbi:MAG: DUF1109 domain-containing protein [Pseudomonadota bacterium]
MSDPVSMNKSAVSDSGGFSLSDLVDDLEPVNPLRIRDGMAMAITLTLFVGAGISFFLGLRNGLTSGQIETVYLLRLAALLLVGGVSGYAAMSMARPTIDNNRRSAETLAWRSALGIAAIFPLLAAINIFSDIPPADQLDKMLYVKTVARECLTYSSISALIVGTGIVLWLRRGAVTDPERAGWLVGLAAGGFGAAAYSIYCPINTVVYIGTWFTVAVTLSAIAGRLIVPRLLRW